MNKKKLFFFINSYNYSDVKYQVAELFVHFYKIEKFYNFYQFVYISSSNRYKENLYSIFYRVILL